MAAQEILKLIEGVDPKDTEKMGEIDARVEAFIYGGTAYTYTVGLENEYTVWGVKNGRDKNRGKYYDRSKK